MSEGRADFVEGYIVMEEFFEGGGFAVGDATGNDEVEKAKIGGDVVGEAVGSDPAADVDTDGGEFLVGNVARRLDPDAGFAGNAIGGDAEIGGGANHGFFEGANVPVDIAAVAIEIEDGIADDLAWAVIGDIAAAIGFAEFDAFLTKDVLGSEKMFLVGAAAEGDDMRVFTEEENVVDEAGFAGGDEALLESVSGIPAGDSEVANEEG